MASTTPAAPDSRSILELLPQTAEATRFYVLSGTEVTDDLLKKCAAVFSANYGVWGPGAPAPLKPGSRVKMTSAKLRAQCLSSPEDAVLSLCVERGILIGHAFATKWQYGHDTVGWVTQLVVDSRHRRRYIATSLLQNLKQHPWSSGITIMGIASSHPSALHTLCKLCGTSPRDIDQGFITTHAAPALACANVNYIKGATPRGSLHHSTESEESGAVVSLIDTQYPIDHTEPNEALAEYRKLDKWPLGSLLEGHEFLLLVPVSPRA